MMDKIIEKNKFLEDENFEIININNLNNLDIDNIYLEGYAIKIINNYTFKDVYNNEIHPFVLEKDTIFKNNNLYINPEYYLKNQEYVDNILCDYIKSYKKEKLSINSLGLIKDNIIDAIVNNSNIKEVDLAKYAKDGYTLTKEHYLKFKKAGIKVDSKYVSDDLEENFDDIIKHNSEKYLIEYFRYKDLINSKAINLHNELKDEDIENLKYINPDTMIIFHINNYEHIFNINKKLKDLNKNNTIKIIIKDKLQFNEFIFKNNIKDKNIYVDTPDLESVSLNDYLKFEKILYEMIKNTNNLSPFEKYIYAYNITKQFKLYKENQEEKNDSRKLYSLLVNEYMVCVGYSRLFGDLLSKMGIENNDLSVSVDTSYDSVKINKIEFKEVKSINLEGHARRYVHLVDPKYNIDGYYISDPTWDNDLEHDYYNHLAMTDKETTYSKRYLYLNIMDVFNVDNISEYIEKMKRIKNNSDYKRFIFELSRVIDVIKKIDASSFATLSSKYVYLNETLNKWPNNITDLVYDLGTTILKKVNKRISGDTIFDAVRNVYKNSYGYKEEELDKVLNEVREYNRARHEVHFPTRFKVNKDESIEHIYSENKFESRKL